MDSSSDFMVSAMYLTPSMALRTSGFLVMGDWKGMALGVGFPEMSVMSKPSPYTHLSGLSLLGRFMVEKNMMWGMVSMNTCERRGKQRAR